MADDHVIKQTVVGRYLVSTIKRLDELKAIDAFLGFLVEDGEFDRANLGIEGDYETMVFDEEGDNPLRELDFSRYLDEEDARRGHEIMVRRWEEVVATEHLAAQPPDSEEEG